ncbi:MAG: ribonuclease HII [Candidatus Doudnabacteria bacterium]|nr:ribonuclease HII [Candidatus Doudnabacteria bacterium]
MITPTYTFETKLLPNYRLIAGIDEVGVAPLAGPVVSAAVILNPEKIGRYRSKTKWWYGVRDSKILSARKRESMIDFIKQNADDYGIGLASHKEIDELNIREATLLAMRRAVENMKIIPEVALIDGRFKIYDLRFKIRQVTIVDGDALVLSIAAASILAKVYRDDLMKNYAQKFPAYGFEKHKGYDTDFHRKNLLRYGPCEIHRMTYQTVKDIMNERWGARVV